ncbi:MAG: 2-succinyl-5-enolpyruvyl-6-hydroxy-3-cyclohexene-1-carboxylic-acid synthase [Clostridia bacterium]|nr:2-succinyl-5-enolpyruvyl-6-hydroxy-3-cyclohexene-1-carboxylic-acid synthase [Clostridia bacterium]
MYSNIRSIQILVSLLKQNDIKEIVISPGGSDIPLIHSIEKDPFFNCYSVVDERSAAYFALGVSLQKQCVVACICTSGTAVCNYLPGITEAWYQSRPVLAITCDKNPYYQNQLETQKIEQTKVFDGVVKKSVSLPVIKDEEDEWLCNRLINEALLELDHHGSGPCHINVPITQRYDIYDCEKLPTERKIDLISFSKIDFNSIHENLVGYKRIMVVVGQNVNFDKKMISNFEKFFNRYKCFFSIETLSNINCEGCINTYPLTETRLSSNLLPDLVISIGNNLAAYGLKPFLRNGYKSICNWLISENGNVRDAYKCLTRIYECSVAEFFDGLMSLEKNDKNDMLYYNLWKSQIDKFILPEFEFSNLYVAKGLSQIVPENSVLHTAILNSTRVMQFFNLNNNVMAYSNVGALGIDGCLSTFAGQAASTNELAYLLIGDLSFFYDMNAAGLRNISKNVRIILINNGGGGEFHFFVGKEKIPEINDYISAKHSKIAAGWVVSLGYDYYFATCKEEFDNAIEKFSHESDKPMFLEVFTDMEFEANNTNKFYNQNRNQVGNPVVNSLSKLFSSKQKERIKKILSFLKGFKK